MTKQTNFTCLELFAGCGGLGWGFEKEGFNIVCCNELEAQISETYRENFKDTNIIVGDITKKEIKNQIYKDFEKVKCDIIIGGPPCVAYSMSGHRNSRDPRGQLFKDYIKIVEKLQPKMFVMENVKGILTIKHDKETLTPNEKELADKYYKLEEEKIKLLEQKKQLSSKKKKESDNSTKKEENLEALKKVNKNIKSMKTKIDCFRVNVTSIIISIFDKLGYNVEMKLLNSANYGVPQKRERVIFIGYKKGLNISIKYPEETHNEKGSDGKLKWKSVKEAIQDLEGDRKEDIETLQHIITKHSDKFLEKIKKTPIGKSVNPKYTEAFFKCDPNKPSNTVKENHGGVFVHYKNNRVMTPRELARLQSFPDTFKFKGSKSSMLVQLGNAVPCLLSKAIAKQIKKMLCGVID